MKKPTQEEVDALYIKMKNESEDGGYRFNPDTEFVKGLLESLLVNAERYGYQACPCRLATGKKEEDLDIIVTTGMLMSKSLEPVTAHCTCLKRLQKV
jgi:ferredoxin-thioredoxin reductase catalytic subunit